MKVSKYNLFIPCDGEILLFNTLSGETFSIDDKVKIALESSSIDKLDEAQKKEFIDKKILIDDDVDELKIIDYYHNKTKYSNLNLTYTILLTWACNLRCVYCYEGAGEHKDYSMNKETANKLIKHIIKETLDRGSKSLGIILFGGEPLINFQIGKYILEKLKTHCVENSIDLHTGIVTNGTLLNEDIIKTLIEFNCEFVQITLDGIKEIHDKRRIGKNKEGTFDNIITNLKRLNVFSDKLPVVIRINIDKTNIKHIRELLEYLKEEGLNNLPIDFGIVRGSTEACQSYDDNCYIEDDLGDLLSGLWKVANQNQFKSRQRPIRKWTYCGLNNDNNFTIEPNGDVYKCWEHTGSKEHIIGTLGNEGHIENIQTSFYNWMTKNPLNIEACRNCIYLPSCGGGCGSVIYAETGKYESEGCLKIKGVVEEQVKNWYKNLCK